jgi:Asp/Glu/hydantoin racemase
MEGKRRVGLIRVLTTTDVKLLNLHGELVMGYFPGLDVLSACIPDQPEGVHDDKTERMAVPKVLALARKMEETGVEAVIVSCAGDPGVDLAAAALKIPVVGAGRAVAAVARALDLPVGVLGLTPLAPDPVAKILGDLVIANLVPHGVRSTLDLMTPHGKESVLASGKKLKEMGARAILLACTGMSTIGAAGFLTGELRIPVIDPVRSEAAVAWTLLG